MTARQTNGQEREKLIEELKQIRVRLTRIYMELGNPKNCSADMMLNRDIRKFEEGGD